MKVGMDQESLRKNCKRRIRKRRKRRNLVEELRSLRSKGTRMMKMGMRKVLMINTSRICICLET